MNCSDFSWDDCREEDRNRVDWEDGDVVWNPKDPGAHVLNGRTEERTYGWTTVTFPRCECGQVDMEDHHVFMLKKSDTLDLPESGPEPCPSSSHDDCTCEKTHWR